MNSILKRESEIYRINKRETIVSSLYVFFRENQNILECLQLLRSTPNALMIPKNPFRIPFLRRGFSFVKKSFAYIR